MKRFLLCAFMFISFSYSLFPQADTTYWSNKNVSDDSQGTEDATFKNPFWHIYSD